MDFAASHEPSVARYDVMLASIKEEDALEPPGGALLSPETRVEYRPPSPGAWLQGSQPRPSSAHANPTAHGGGHDVALTYLGQDAVATGGRVFSARPQAVSMRSGAHATEYLHALDAHDSCARPQSAARSSSPDRPLAYARQRPASASTARPASAIEVVYGVEPPPSCSSGSHERRRRRPKRGGAPPEWDSSVACPRAPPPLAAYTAALDPSVFTGYPRKYAELHGLPSELASSHRTPSHRTPHAAGKLLQALAARPHEPDEPVSRALAASMPSAASPGPRYAYGDAPPTAAAAAAAAAARRRPASAPASRADASGGTKPVWGSNPAKDPTRRELLTVVTRHGGHARPASSGVSKGNTTAAFAGQGQRGPQASTVPPPPSRPAGGVPPLVLPATFRVAQPPKPKAPPADKAAAAAPPHQAEAAAYLAGGYANSRAAKHVQQVKKGVGARAGSRPSRHMAADASTPFHAAPQSAGYYPFHSAPMAGGGRRGDNQRGGGRGKGGGAFGRRVEVIYDRALSIRRELERERHTGGGDLADSVSSDRLADAVERAVADLGGGDRDLGSGDRGVHLERLQLEQLQQALRAVRPVGEVGRLQLLSLAAAAEAEGEAALRVGEWRGELRAAELDQPSFEAGFARLRAAVEEACQGDELLMRDLEEWRTRYFSPASVDHGLQLAWLLLALRRHHQRAQAVGAAVRQREALLCNLGLLCARVGGAAPQAAAGQSAPALETPRLRASVAAELHSLVALVRRSSVRVVEAVLAWRAGLRRPLPFEVQGSGSGNYLLAMAAEPEELTRPHIAALLQEAQPKGPSEVALDAARLWAARQVITREPELQARLQGAPAQEGRGGFDPAGRGLTTLRWSPLDEAQVRAELLGAGSAGDGRYILYEVVDTHA